MSQLQLTLVSTMPGQKNKKLKWFCSPKSSLMSKNKEQINIVWELF